MEPLRNNHYVPQFILRQYGDHLCVFDAKQQQFFEGRNSRSLYCEKGLYPDDIEDGLQQRVETPFAEFLHKTNLLSEKQITLNHDQLNLFHKFLVISILRTKDTPKGISQDRFFYQRLAQMMKAGGQSDQAVASALPPFAEKDTEKLSDTEYWYRTLRCLIAAPDVNPETIALRPDATYSAYRWATVLYSGYLAFWDASPYQDEFVLTDAGMTSELEPDWNNPYHPSNKKIETMQKLISQDTFADLHYTELLLRTTAGMVPFIENFMMFPLSAHRMVVLVNPFFKFWAIARLRKIAMPSLAAYTTFPDEKLFAPNESHFVFAQRNFLKVQYDPGDSYVYHPVHLSGSETRRCNAFFMDQIYDLLAFSSLEKVRRSIKYYRSSEKKFVPRVDYSALYKIIGLK